MTDDLILVGSRSAAEQAIAAQDEFATSDFSIEKHELKL
jgi:hypothetical protein